MKYEKPEVVTVRNVIESVLGTKPGSPDCDHSSFKTPAAYEADE
ncbi:MAG: hypothetical protein WBG02_05745 [Candidatus Acidiferrum sp.]